MAAGTHVAKRMIRGMFILIVAMAGEVCKTAGETPAPSALPDTFGDMVLTPWWPLKFSTGEMLQVDCGVYTGGDITNITMYWKDPNGDIINEDNTSRVRSHRTDKNYPEDKQNGAFSVLTLTMEVTFNDRGPFMCIVEHQTPEGVMYHNKTVTVDVSASEILCGFESHDLCGWRVDNTSDISWYWHDGKDPSSMSRMKALRYDHTYGASKHSGHFLDVDIKRDKINTDSKARLISSKYEAHDKERCMEFWYILHGTDYEYLKVLLQPVDNETHSANATELFSTNNNTKGEWQLGQVAIPQQEAPYNIIIEAVPCKDSKEKQCRLGAIAVDDVRIYDHQCADVTYSWPDNRLKVRLVNGTAPSNGRVEVLHDGRWGSVCSTQFGDLDAIVICKMLGYNDFGAKAKRISPYGTAPSNYIIWLHKVACSGQESEVGSCLSKGEAWGDTQCKHDTDAAVRCEETFISTEASKTFKSSTTTNKMTVAPPPIKKNKTTTPITTVTTPNASATTTAITTTETTSKAPTTSPKVVITSTTHSTKPQPTPVVTLIVTEKEVEKESATATMLMTINETEKTHLPNTTESLRSFLQEHKGLGAGAAVTISFLVIILITVVVIFLYRKRKYVSKKSNYIVFSNPKYHRDHLPSNDISLDSPLTSNLSILA